MCPAQDERGKRGGLFPVPAGAGGGVFEDDAAGDEVVTDGVGCGEITAAARRLALADQPLDLGDRHVGARVLDAPQRDDTEHQPGSHYGYRCIDNLPSTNC